MRRLIAVLATLALLTAGLAFAATSALGGGRSGRTISLIEHPNTDKVTDLGEPGDSVGDLLTFANPIFDSKDQKQVAHDQGYCIRVDAGVSWECTWTNFLKGGQIVVQGPFFDAKPSNLAITGGTGKYAKVRGWMHLKSIGNEEAFSFVFHLR